MERLSRGGTLLNAQRRGRVGGWAKTITERHAPIRDPHCHPPGTVRYIPYIPSTYAQVAFAISSSTREGSARSSTSARPPIRKALWTRSGGGLQRSDHDRQGSYGTGWAQSLREPWTGPGVQTDARRGGDDDRQETHERRRDDQAALRGARTSGDRSARREASQLLRQERAGSGEEDPPGPSRAGAGPERTARRLPPTWKAGWPVP